MVGTQELKQEKCVTYLGEEIHESGLEASIDATITARQGKIRGSIQALAALWGDHRMQLVGSTLGALDMYESCIVSSLLNNAEVWVGLTEEQEKRLDGYQLEFLRALMHLPVSTPKACLLAATSRMKMRWRVWERKLLLILAIRQQGEDVLARQVLEEQVELGLPGLGREVTDICYKLGLEDICRGRPDRVTKELIKEQVFYHHLKHIKEELNSLKEKGKELAMVDIRKPQEYLASCSLEEARMAFRVQNRMLDIPGDMPGRYLGREACEACLAWRREDEQEEAAPTVTREHLEECRGYAFLRAGKDLFVSSDRTRYFLAVMRMRNKK